MACPECGYTHRLAAQSAMPDTNDSSPAVALQPPAMIAYQTTSSSAPVIRHKRRRLTAVAGSSVPPLRGLRQSGRAWRGAVRAA